MAKHQFQTEVNQLLQLMIHSLYSNKEIFLRELISNSSDALDKLNYLTISEEKYKALNFEPKIEITINKDEKSITISDNGIGMSDEDLVEHLGTIAKSGTKSFLKNLSGDAKKDSNLIGQFGVGFYASFMVAKSVKVVTKKAGEEIAYAWSSEGDGEYDIVLADKDSFGTDVTLYLRDEEDEFLESYRLESIIKKYSNHIPFKIFLTKDEKLEQINKASALWRMSKSELKDEDYKDFYKSIAHDSSDPFAYFHHKAEGTLEYTTLFYIPKKAPFDLFRVDYTSGIKLYIKRVFITDDDKELIPTYLRFLRGVIDSEDLPLNVSREILQQNAILQKIKTNSTKKILSELEKISKNDRARYVEFFSEFGRVLKEGLYSDFENRENLLELMLFKSSKRDGLVSLAEYKDAMKEGQDAIYYILGEDEKLLKNSPLLEKFNEDGVEVLILDTEVDNIVMPMVHKYKEIDLKSVSSVTSAEALMGYEDFVNRVKEILKDDIKDVKVTNRLKNSPSCLVYDDSDPSNAMNKILKQMGQAVPDAKPIFEINIEHPIIKKLLTNDKIFEDGIKLLFDGAKMAEGSKLSDMSEYIQRVNRVLLQAL